MTLSPSQAGKPGNRVRAIDSSEKDGITTVRIHGSATPTFTVYRLERPARVVVDVVGSDLDRALIGGEGKAVIAVNTWAVGHVSAHTFAQSRGTVVRVVIGLARSSSYKVRAQGQDVVVTVSPREKAPGSSVKRTSEDSAAAARARAQAEKELARARAEADQIRRQAVEHSVQAQEALAQAEELKRAAQDRLRQATQTGNSADKAVTLARKKTEAAEAAVARAAKEQLAARHAQQRADRLREEARQAGAADAERLKAAAREAIAEAAALKKQAKKAVREAAERRTAAEALVAEAEQRRAQAEAAMAVATKERELAEKGATLADKGRRRAEADRLAAEEAARAAAERAAELSRRAEAEEKRAEEARLLRLREEKALARAEAARRDAERRRSEATKTRASVDASNRKLRALETQVEQSRRLSRAAADEYERTVAKQQASAAEIAALKTRKAELESQRAAAEREFSDQRKLVSELTVKSKKLEASQRQASAQLAALRGELESVRKTRVAEEERLGELARARAAAQAELAEARRARAEIEARMVKSQADQDAALTRLRDEAERERAKLAKARQEAEQERAVTAKARAEAERERAVTAQARAEAERAREVTAKAREEAERERDETARARAEAERERVAIAETRAEAERALKSAEQVQKRAAKELDSARAARVAAEKAGRDRGREKAADKPGVVAGIPAVSSLDVVGKDDISRIQIALTGPATPRVITNRGSKAVLEIPGVSIPKSLERTLDVASRSGPIKSVSSYASPSDQRAVRIAVDLDEPSQGVLKRKGNTYYWDFPGKRAVARARDKSGKSSTVRASDYRTAAVAGYGSSSAPITQQTVAQMKKKKRTYSGKKIDLDYRNADIHNLMRLLADVGDVNIVIPDDIKASVTIRLRRVPWDQALDVILASKGLGYKQEGPRLLRVASKEELQKELEAKIALAKQRADSEAPEAEVFNLNYVKAGNVQQQVEALKSAKGSIQVEERTNAVIINDLAANRRRIVDLLTRLDTQTPQIQIEARVVEARSTYVRELGIQWGGNMSASAAGGNSTGLVFPNSVVVAGGNSDGQTPTSGVYATPSDFAINLPASTGTGAGGAIGLALGSVGGNFNLNLRLSALEDTGSVRIISAPKITTSNNIEAEIKSGISIPISVVSANGVNTQFVQADLSLKVKPTVSLRDCAVSMDIIVKKNEADFVNTGARGDPSILTKEAKTTVLVGDGDTSVIGGIYTRNTGLAYAKVPFFGDLPVLGWFFKKRRENDSRAEVLVFITPKITNRDALPCQ